MRLLLCFIASAVALDIITHVEYTIHTFIPVQVGGFASLNVHVNQSGSQILFPPRCVYTRHGGYGPFEQVYNITFHHIKSPYDDILNYLKHRAYPLLLVRLRDVIHRDWLLCCVVWSSISMTPIMWKEIEIPFETMVVRPDTVTHKYIDSVGYKTAYKFVNSTPIRRIWVFPDDLH